MPEPRKIKKVGDLINALNKDIIDGTSPTWYRGESDSSWELLAGYDRLIKPPSEIELVNKFRQNASSNRTKLLINRTNNYPPITNIFIKKTF